MTHIITYRILALCTISIKNLITRENVMLISLLVFQELEKRQKTALGDYDTKKVQGYHFYSLI